jgi:hypothetical protein
MANYVSSNLVAAQAKFSSEFLAPEIRRKQNPALVLALKNLTATLPTHTDLRAREDRAVNAYLLKKILPGAGTTRAARPTGTVGDSVQVGLTWQTVTETFNWSFKQGDTNIFSGQDMLQNQIKQAVLNLHSRIGTILLNYLYATRNQILSIPYTAAAVQGVTTNNTFFSYEVAGSDRNFFFQKAVNVMRQLNHIGTFDIIADPNAFVLAQQLKAMGAQNANNLAFQFDGIQDLIMTNEVIDANYGTNGSCLAMPSGTFALLPWIPKQNREGSGDYDSYVGGWGTFQDPFGLSIDELQTDATGKLVTVANPLTYSVYAYSQASDNGANNGQTQDRVTTFEFSLDFAPTLAPLSGANESVVNEFALLG